MPDSRTITPFWLQAKAVILYPAKSACLAVIASYSALQLLTLLPLFLLGTIIKIALFLGMYKYAYEILDHIARGNREPPEVSLRSSGMWIAAKQSFIILVLLFVISTVFANLGVVAGFLISAVFILAFPAMIIFLAIEMKVFSALNPISWMGLINRIGKAYYLLPVALGLLWLTSFVISFFILPILPSFVALVVEYFINYYFLIAMFYLMGYVIYQYHEELGFELSETADALPLRNGVAEDRDPILDEVDLLLDEGKLTEAIKTLASQIKAQGALPDVHEKYRELLAQNKDTAELNNHAKQYVNVLLAHDNIKAALKLIGECFSIDTGFVFSDPQHVKLFANHAIAKSQNRLALQITNGFAKKYPKHKHIPDNYFTAAKILADKMGQIEKATKILQYIVTTYPKHRQSTEFKQYLDVLLTMA